MKIFLSYGHDQNTPLVERICEDLKKAGHDPWLDTTAIPPGADWRREIVKGLNESDWALAFLSKHSSREPGVCLDELAIAVNVKGGAIATILVEAEQEVRPPVSISHIEWFDMQDWKEHHAKGGGAWEEWYRPKFKEILALLESPNVKRFAGEIQELKQYLAPISQASDIDALLNGFVGRKWLAAKVDQWRTQHINSRVLWISGAPGSGKSAFAAWLAHHGKVNVIGLNLCRYNDDERRDARRVLCTLAFQIATRIPSYRFTLLQHLRLNKKSDPAGNEVRGRAPPVLFDRLLARPLQENIDGGQRGDRLLVVIDALDESIQDGRSELAEVLAERAPTLPAWLGIVVTSRPEEPINRQFAGLAPQSIVAEAAENLDDLRHYVREWRENYQQSASVESIVAASGGNFLYVRKLTEAINEGVIDLSTIGDFPPGLTGIYEMWFRRLFPDKSAYATHVPLLQVLVAAEHPVPEDWLARLFGWSLPQRAVMLERLGSLFERRADGVAPFHKSLRDWLIDSRAAGAFAVDATEGAKRLAAGLWATFAQWVDRPDRAALELFCLYELPLQLSKAGPDDVRKLLGHAPAWPRIAAGFMEVANAQASALAWDRALQWWQTLAALADHIGEAADRDKANALMQIGDALILQGRSEGALKAYSDCLPIRERVRKTDPNNVLWLSELALCYGKLASAQLRQSSVATSHSDAEKSLRQARGIFDRLTHIDPDNVEWQCMLAVSHIDVGELEKNGRPNEAMKSFRASLAVAEKIKNDADRQLALGSAYHSIGFLQLDQEDLDGALQTIRDCLAIAENLVKADPNNAERQQQLAVRKMYVGDIRLKQKNTQDALKWYREALATFERLAKLYPDNPNYQRNLSAAHINIAWVYDSERKYSEALKAVRASLDINEGLVRRDPSNADWQRHLAASYMHLGGVQRALGNPDEALKAFRANLAIWEKVASVDLKDLAQRRGLAEAHEQVSYTQDINGDVDGALQSFGKGLAIR